MLFFFKEKPIEIKAYCNSMYAFANAFSPIVPAIEEIPQWWKNTPKGSFSWEERASTNTVRSCPGIINTFTNGFILPLWCDLALQYNNLEYVYNFSDKITRITEHGEIQSPGFYSDYWHLKIDSPWFIETPIKMLLAQPTYLKNEPFPYLTPYGIVTPVKNLISTNIFIFPKKEKEIKRLMINQGEPLLHIIPLTDKKVKFSTEVLSEEDYLRKHSIIGTPNRFNKRGLKNIVSA